MDRFCSKPKAIDIGFLQFTIEGFLRQIETRHSLLTFDLRDEFLSYNLRPFGVQADFAQNPRLYITIGVLNDIQ